MLIKKKYMQNNDVNEQNNQKKAKPQNPIGKTPHIKNLHINKGIQQN